MCYECAWPCCTHAIISWMPRCLLAIFPEPSHTWGHSLSWVLHFENWCRSFSHYRIKIIHTIHLAFIICCLIRLVIFLEAHILFADYWKTGYYARVFYISRTVQVSNILLHCQKTVTFPRDMDNIQGKVRILVQSFCRWGMLKTSVESNTVAVLF